MEQPKHSSGWPHTGTMASHSGDWEKVGEQPTHSLGCPPLLEHWPTVIKYIHTHMHTDTSTQSGKQWWLRKGGRTAHSLDGLPPPAGTLANRCRYTHRHMHAKTNTQSGKHQPTNSSYHLHPTTPLYLMQGHLARAKVQPNCVVQQRKQNINRWHISISTNRDRGTAANHQHNVQCYACVDGHGPCTHTTTTTAHWQTLNESRRSSLHNTHSWNVLPHSCHTLKTASNGAQQWMNERGREREKEEMRKLEIINLLEWSSWDLVELCCLLPFKNTTVTHNRLQHWERNLTMKSSHCGKKATCLNSIRTRQICGYQRSFIIKFILVSIIDKFSLFTWIDIMVGWPHLEHGWNVWKAKREVWSCVLRVMPFLCAMTISCKLHKMVEMQIPAREHRIDWIHWSIRVWNDGNCDIMHCGQDSRFLRHPVSDSLQTPIPENTCGQTNRWLR